MFIGVNDLDEKSIEGIINITISKKKPDLTSESILEVIGTNPKPGVIALLNGKEEESTTARGSYYLYLLSNPDFPKFFYNNSN